MEIKEKWFQKNVEEGRVKGNKVASCSMKSQIGKKRKGDKRKWGQTPIRTKINYLWLIN